MSWQTYGDFSMKLDEVIEATYPQMFAPYMYYRVIKSPLTPGYEIVIGFEDNIDNKAMQWDLTMLRTLINRVLLSYYGVRPDNLTDVLSACLFVMNKHEKVSYKELAKKLNLAIYYTIWWIGYFQSIDYSQLSESKKSCIDEIMAGSEHEGGLDLSGVSSKITLFLFALLQTLNPGRKNDTPFDRKQRGHDILESLQYEVDEMYNGERVPWDNNSEPIMREMISNVLRSWKNRVGSNWLEDMSPEFRKEVFETINPLREWIYSGLSLPSLNYLSKLSHWNGYTDYYDGLDSIDVGFDYYSFRSSVMLEKKGRKSTSS